MVYPALLQLMRTPRLPVASTLHTTSEHGVSSTTTADAHTSAASSRLNWRPPADLNGLVRFAERRNLVSARVPSHFNWPLRHNTKMYGYYSKNRTYETHANFCRSLQILAHKHSPTQFHQFSFCTARIPFVQHTRKTFKHARTPRGKPCLISSKKN